MPFSQLILVLLTVVCLTPSAHASDVATLNRVTFNGNIFANREGEGPEGFVVLFCAEWFEPCQQFQETFVAAAAQHGGASYDDLYSRKTRFAQVDCAVDKVLCNSQDVDVYPTVVRYRRGGRVGEWAQSGRTQAKEAASFTKWVAKQMQQLDGPFAASSAPAGKDLEAQGTPVALAAKFSVGIPVGQLIPFLVMMAAGTMWIFRLGTELWQGAQLLRADPSERRARQKHEEEARLEEEAQPPPAELAVELPVLLRSLPDVWAKSSFEL